MRTLGPYQLMRKIGSGGMAEVWSARRESNAVGGEKFAAIKILARHVADNPRYREMFMGEAKLSLVLNHPNIVTVFDVVEDRGECYMVMELIEGMTLSQLCRGLRKRGEMLPTDVTVYVVSELLRALSYAHTLETDAGSTIVHRDVSPQNVMVTTSGAVKLMDFGIARFSTQETSGNLVKGKLQYMPPEQLAKRTREPTIDLFAVGGVLHELLEGTRFRGGVDQEVLLGMVMRGESPEPTVEMPEPLDRVRRQLLDPDPNARLSSAKEALRQLYDWPGYRNASLQLEELVCEFVAPSSSMSLPGLEFDDESASQSFPTGESLVSVAAPEVLELEVDSEEVDSVSEGAFVQPSATGGGPRSTREAEPDTETGLPHAAATPLDESFDESLTQAPGKLAGLIGAGTIALLGLVVFVVWVVGGPEPEPEPEPAPTQAVTADRASAPAPQPTAAPDPQLEVRPPSNETTTSGADDADSDEPEPEPEPEAEPEPDDDQAEVKQTTPKVSVEFVANDFYFVYIKVGGRVLTLEPKVSLRLPVGKHVVYLKQKQSDDWTRAGSIDLSRGQSYRAEMKKPAGLRLIEK